MGNQPGTGAGMKYAFEFSTIVISKEWTQDYFDAWQQKGWELLNISPSSVFDVHYCYWRKPKP